MRVAIAYTVDVSDADRLAIAAERDNLDIHYTDSGDAYVVGLRLATRDEIRDFYESYGLASEGTIGDWTRTIEESAKTVRKHGITTPPMPGGSTKIIRLPN